MTQLGSTVPMGQVRKRLLMRTENKEPETRKEDQERVWCLRRKGRSKFETSMSLRALKLPQRNKEEGSCTRGLHYCIPWLLGRNFL